MIKPKTEQKNHSNLLCETKSGFVKIHVVYVDVGSAANPAFFKGFSLLDSSCEIMKASAHTHLLFTALLQCLGAWNKLQVLLVKALQLATFHCGLYQLVLKNSVFKL